MPARQPPTRHPLSKEHARLPITSKSLPRLQGISGKDRLGLRLLVSSEGTRHDDVDVRRDLQGRPSVQVPGGGTAHISRAPLCPLGLMW
jgi:hypothetical protein